MKQEVYDDKCKQSRQALLEKDVSIEYMVKSLKKSELHKADMSIVLMMLEKNFLEKLADTIEKLIAENSICPWQLSNVKMISPGTNLFHDAIYAKNVPFFVTKKCYKEEVSPPCFSTEKIMVVLRYALILLVMALCGVIMLKNHRHAIQIMLRVFGKGEPATEVYKKRKTKNRPKNKEKE